MSKQFGGRLTQKWKTIYEQSPNWKSGKFENLENTQAGVDWKRVPGMLCKQIKGHPEGNPPLPLSVVDFDKQTFLNQEGIAQFIWYGHSVVLMRLMNKNILIDPMLGPDASPIAPTKTKRFSDSSLEIINDLPEIDLMLITHDHYDHLDYASIERLKTKTKQFFVALGIKRHLVSWGIKEDTITEFDWWDAQTFNDIKITFTPTRHFSGRGLTSMAKSLWGGWVLKTSTENIWFSGDGGYGAHFKEIGKTLGPFDFAFMECGQYSEDWPQIHMFPEQSVQAAIDAKVQKAMPVHWAGFNLSYAHSWYEPAEEFMKHAELKKLPTTYPKIGENIDLKHNSAAKWWNK